MATKADETVAALQALGYTGSIQDMQHAYLVVLNLGVEESTADLYLEHLGTPVRELIDESLIP